ncbi:hypothetical protein C2845_PM09G13890 [Panicum miliaceum]|uniref:Uncharacterized protein n=1 Tax=Panicum miliaceum TaxID=4540 RepID=A0A3L6S1N5_PANMI|nr:hypothetical protein C2845_PM09G13890 [Panicum miliaceum]
MAGDGEPNTRPRRVPVNEAEIEDTGFRSGQLIGDMWKWLITEVKLSLQKYEMRAMAVAPHCCHNGQLMQGNRRRQKVLNAKQPSAVFYAVIVHELMWQEMGRGCLKGLAAVAKRSKFQSQKMKIKFSKNLGGPCGDNRHTFVDEVVLLTKQNAPLIGVRYWRDVSRHVKEDIAECIMDYWDLETTENPKKKVWNVAMERYKGWRSALHSTYKAYNSYDKRMKNKPEDIDIVEWHYLNKYFATRQFKSKSSNNSVNRKQLKTSHSGVPNLSLSGVGKRGGEWTDEVADSIYNMQPIPATSNNTTEVDARSTGDNPDATPVLHSQETRNQHTPQTNNNTTVDEAGSTEDNIAATQVVHSQQLAKQIAPRSILTTDRSNLAPSKNANTANVAKSLFNKNRGRGAGAAAGFKYISSQQLVSGAKTRAGKKKAQ